MKSGLEIHFQLLTKRKLFCNCSTDCKEKQPIKIIERKIHPVESEIGEVDIVVQYESLRNRTFFYEVFENESCEVETDEEPPLPINREALEIALQIAMLLNCYIPRELHTMRKIVIDGSNVSGFQRTLIVGINGFLNFKGKRIEIKQVTLEEDAASISKIEENKVFYKLNRLGIPLCEISTGILEGFTPKEIEEIALEIGKICFSTRKVKKVIGSIRQDVNVSTEYFGRIEIKGVQELSLISKTLELEIERQKNLYEIIKNIKFEIEKKVFDVTEIFKNSKSKIIRKVIDSNGKVFAIKLPNFSGLLKTKLLEEKTFGKELAEFVQNFGLGGIIHSDEDLKKYNFEENEIEKLKNVLELNEKDAFVLIADNLYNGKIAEYLIDRINSIIKRSGEVRVAEENGYTKFIRPLPTRARMYPETDIPIIYIEDDFLEKLRKNLPEHLDKLVEKLVSEGFSKDLANQIVFSEHYNFFEYLSKRFSKIDKKIIASFFVSTLKNLEREGLEVKNETIEKVFEMLENDLIVKEAIEEIIRVSIKEKKSIEEIINNFGFRKMSYEELEKEVKEEIENLKNLPKEKIYNILMKKFRLRADYKDIKNILDSIF